MSSDEELREAGGVDREDELTRLLEEVGQMEKSILDEALQLGDAPGVNQVAGVLEDEWSSGKVDAAEPAPQGFRWAGALAIAAALVAMFAVWRVSQPSNNPDGPGPANTTLGADDFAAVYPPSSKASDVESWDYVEWTAYSDARIYQLLIFPADSDDELYSADTTETKVDLSGVDTSAWGSELWISVRALGDSREDSLKTLEWAANRKTD